VSRGVDNIETVAIPLTGDRRRLNSNTALGFLFHEIGSGFTIVNLTGLMDLAGQLQNTFRGRGFTGIHVRENTYVSIFG
jgi:hypothetical protein